MSREDYYKFIVGDEKRSVMQERIGIALEKGIKNAYKASERPVNYRFGKKWKMIGAIKNKGL